MNQPHLSGRMSWRGAGAILLGYLLVTVVVTFPLAFTLSGSTLGEAIVDKQNHLWDFWWGYRAVVDPGRSFYFTDFLYYPPGASLWHASSGPLLFYVGALPMALLQDLDATYNLVILLSLLCSCVGGYCLGRRLFGDRATAFYTGIFLAFNPLTLYQIKVGLVEFINLGWSALFIASLHRLHSRRDWRSVLVSWGWFLLATTWSWYIGYLLLMAAGLYMVLRVRWRQVLGGPRKQAAMLALWAVVICLFSLSLSMKVGVGQVEERLRAPERQMLHGMAGRSMTLDVDTPGFLDPLARELKVEDRLGVAALELKMATSVDPADALHGWRPDHPMEAYFPLRWLVPALLALLAAALHFRRRRLLPYFVMVVVGLLLALGPCLQWGKVVSWDTCGRTPYSLLSLVLPGLDRVQFPRRLLLLTVFGLTVLTGHGLLALLGRLGQSRTRRLALVSALCLLTVIPAIHIIRYPMMRSSFLVPSFYRQLGQDKEMCALVEVPFVSGDGVKNNNPRSRFTYYQTVHQKRQLAGPMPDYLAQYGYPEAIKNNPLLDHLRRLQRGRAAPGPDMAALERGLKPLRDHGFRFLVLHPRDLTPAAGQAAARDLTRLLGPPQRDDSLAADPLRIYRLSSLPPPGDGGD